jgi:iron complex transport system substrate-binding protein
MKRTLYRCLALLLAIVPPTLQAQTVVRDDLGVHRFARVPQRVVSLSWESTEQLLQLGITPIGVAEGDGYRTWVVRPALPAASRSVGSRLEPNLELVAALKPDLIVIGPTLQSQLPLLSRIAPVLLFDAYRSDHDNAAKAKSVYLQLARLFDREAPARARLHALDRDLARLRTSLHRHWGAGAPPVQVIRFANSTMAYAYGGNSMPVQALQCLGLRPASTAPGLAWGIRSTPLLAMDAWSRDIVLYQQPFDQADKLFPSPLWQAMPFVRDHRFAAMRSTWSYGGLFSIYYLADAITAAMLTLPAGTGAAEPFTRPSARDCVLAAD